MLYLFIILVKKYNLEIFFRLLDKEMSATKLYPSASLELITNVEERFHKKYRILSIEFR